MINAERVLDLRRQGKTMWEIAATLYSEDFGVSIKEIETVRPIRNDMENKYLFKDGMVADICMNEMKVDEDYDHDAGVALVGAIINSAVKDYGEAKTTQILLSKKTKQPEPMPQTRDVCTAINFFNSKHFPDFMDCICESNKYPVGGELTRILDVQAHEGRWMNFNNMVFETKAEAEKMIFDYPKYTEGAKVFRSKKTGLWHIRMPYYKEVV